MRGVRGVLLQFDYCSWPQRPITFEVPKVTKVLFSRKASLPHRAFTRQGIRHHGLQNLAPLRSRCGHASASIAMPCLPAWPICAVCPPSEAVLLKGKERKKGKK
ncbi:hypothetical protein [Mucilaginibacter segetis]|uniref:Uncharacterized protein n=1 Tax=Mucilaginibacter segetis TaxID=2793071 RepID=A0A934PSY3_9SPHI|nr:hypothetical protein [Mucilaginibacter segetis]MBK0378611.1 hypothetical protein [Mucilaginibacter segetis]